MLILVPQESFVHVGRYPARARARLVQMRCRITKEPQTETDEGPYLWHRCFFADCWCVILYLFIAHRNTRLTHGIQTVGQQQLLLDPLYAAGKLHHQLGLKGFATRYRFQDISGLIFIICGGDKFPANLSPHRPFTLPVYNHKSND